MLTVLGVRLANVPRNRYIFVSDLILLPVMAYVSFILRLEPDRLFEYWEPATTLAMLNILLIFPVFGGTRLYSRYWLYASVEEFLHMVAAVSALTLAVAVGYITLTSLIPVPWPPLPRSISIIFYLLALPSVALPRLAIHFLATLSPRTSFSLPQPTLIIGAGEMGAMVVRELRRNRRLGMIPIGFLDDDPTKWRMRIRGVAVLGALHNFPEIARAKQVSRVIIAMPMVPGSVIQRIVRSCDSSGVRVQTIPNIAKLLDSTVSVSHLRDVEIEDLLRREPIQTDISAVVASLRGKSVLITGAGGSIGSELARQVLMCRPHALILLGHGENSIFAIYNELVRQLDVDSRSNTDRIREPGYQTIIYPVIADIRFPARLQSIFDEHRPDIVFHAAAHKHVPLMEANVAEAVLNNIIGTRNMIEASRQSGVERFVLISTDKAVNPSNVMGACKRVAELLVHQAARASGKPYMVLRFGNVLGSRGSVVPTMKEQIARGGPVTVTHSEITRFFITISEAVQLVLQAMVLGRGGEVFVLDMGEPVKILDMARDLIRLSGLELGQDIDIAITGLRPGEKLYEELFIAGETYQHTFHDKIFIAQNAGQFVTDTLQGDVEELSKALQRNNSSVIKKHLQRIVPEFTTIIGDTTEANLTVP